MLLYRDFILFIFGLVLRICEGLFVFFFFRLFFEVLFSKLFFRVEFYVLFMFFLFEDLGDTFFMLYDRLVLLLLDKD